MLSPLLLARVVEAPQLRAAGSSGPSGAAPSGTRRCAPWRATSPRRGGRRRTRRRSRTCRAPASAPAVFMTSVCTAEPCVNGLMPRSSAFLVDVDEQVEPELGAPCGRGTRIISRNFHVVSTCSSGNGGFAGIERLHRQVQHHRAVLADRIEHHRLLALGDDLAHDVDALGLEPLQVRQVNEGALLECGHRLLTVDEIGRDDPRLRPDGAFAASRTPQASAGRVDTRTVNPPPDSDDARPMEAEAQLDALFSQSGVGMTIVDKDLRIVRVNPVFGVFGDQSPAAADREDDRRGRATAGGADRARNAVGARDGRSGDPGARQARSRRSGEHAVLPLDPLPGRRGRRLGRRRRLHRHRDHRPAQRAARPRRRARTPARERRRRARQPARRGRGFGALPDDLRGSVDRHHPRGSHGPGRRGESGARGDARLLARPSSRR